MRVMRSLIYPKGTIMSKIKKTIIAIAIAAAISALSSFVIKSVLDD